MPIPSLVVSSSTKRLQRQASRRAQAPAPRNHLSRSWTLKSKRSAFERTSSSYASDIGERNVFRPTSLQAAASYVEREWEQQGYAVERLAYDVSGVRCLNLEIAAQRRRT